MQISLSKNSTIYIVSPAGVATGGVEALHQLAYDLRQSFPAAKVFLFYLPQTQEQPVPGAYAYMQLPFVKHIEDVEENLLIISEMYTHKFCEYKKIRKAIWWLSVDNYYLSYDFFMHANIAGRINKRLWRRGIQHYLFFDANLKKVPFHFAQSSYAFEHLKKKGILNVHYLREHLNPAFLSQSAEETDKKDIVAYNPKKGFRFTERVMASSPDIQFVPIQNMTRNQVVDLLQLAKVYIDFGNHPGRDRIPREAAMLGCCVLTGKRGSAKFYEDVSIPEDCKFSESRSDIQLIRKKIQEYFFDYKSQINRFAPYREKIKGEREVYLSDLRGIFSFDDTLYQKNIRKQK